MEVCLVINIFNKTAGNSLGVRKWCAQTVCEKFSTECVEIFFLCQRKQLVPSGWEFKHIFRSLVVVKFMKPSKNSSYDEADEKACWLAS